MPQKKVRESEMHTQKGEAIYIWTGINTLLDKWAKNKEKRIHKREYILIKKIYGKIFSITSNQKNTNKKYNEISFYDY